MKTTAGRYPALEALIRARHSYEVPEITASPIAQGSDDYLQWISRETDGPSN
jgi:periplasmic divalent cation tolerance protein